MLVPAHAQKKNAIGVGKIEHLHSYQRMLIPRASAYINCTSPAPTTFPATCARQSAGQEGGRAGGTANDHRTSVEGRSSAIELQTQSRRPAARRTRRAQGHWSGSRPASTAEPAHAVIFRAPSYALRAQPIHAKDKGSSQPRFMAVKNSEEVFGSVSANVSVEQASTATTGRVASSSAGLARLTRGGLSRATPERCTAAPDRSRRAQGCFASGGEARMGRVISSRWGSFLLVRWQFASLAHTGRIAAVTALPSAQIRAEAVVCSIRGLFPQFSPAARLRLGKPTARQALRIHRNAQLILSPAAQYN